MEGTARILFVAVDPVKSFMRGIKANMHLPPCMESADKSALSFATVRRVITFSWKPDSLLLCEYLWSDIRLQVNAHHGLWWAWQQWIKTILLFGATIPDKIMWSSKRLYDITQELMVRCVELKTWKHLKSVKSVHERHNKMYWLVLNKPETWETIHSGTSKRPFQPYRAMTNSGLISVDVNKLINWPQKHWQLPMSACYDSVNHSRP